VIGRDFKQKEASPNLVVRYMRVVVLTALLFCAIAAIAGELFSIVPWGRAEGKEFKFTVTDADVRSTPAWQPDAANPPLPPLRAQEIARKQLEQFVSDHAKWRLHEISLRNVGDNHWVYVVRFDRQPPEVPTDSASFFIPVLMNGAILQPEVLKPLAR
jgi:hypothetical protein